MHAAAVAYYKGQLSPRLSNFRPCTELYMEQPSNPATELLYASFGLLPIATSTPSAQAARKTIRKISPLADWSLLRGTKSLIPPAHLPWYQLDRLSS
jgi:hypothetical protein